MEQEDRASVKVAVIGSGPAGCYFAEGLSRLLPDCEIDVLDRLATPFGLIRAGVAPDHQNTKAVARVLGRVFLKGPGVFWGNVAVGRDVSLEELSELYDAVVVATGAPADRKLGIPGEDLPGVVGSGAFTCWYNSHPDYVALGHELRQVRGAVVIGNGNVALDVARILAKTEPEMEGSDIASEVMADLAGMPLEAIDIVGRRGPAEAKFTPVELRELGELQRAHPIVEPADLEGIEAESKNLDILRGYAEPSEDADSRPLPIRFRFHLTPDTFLGDARLEAVRFRPSRGGESIEIPAQLAVTCIGYHTLPCCSLMPEDGMIANDEGRIADRLYVVGWAKRGPSGTIGTNRTEAHEVAERLLGEVAPAGRLGRRGLEPLLRERKIQWVDFSAWQKIERAEAARAQPGRVRDKFMTLQEMLAAVEASSREEAEPGQ